MVNDSPAAGRKLPPGAAKGTVGVAKLASFSRASLADDANVSSGGDGFSGITLARAVGSKAGIDQIPDRAGAAGGRITKLAREAERFGGSSGYLAAPDGYVREFVAFSRFASRPT